MQAGALASHLRAKASLEGLFIERVWVVQEIPALEARIQSLETDAERLRQSEQQLQGTCTQREQQLQVRSTAPGHALYCKLLSGCL